MTHVTNELIDQADVFAAEFNAARFGALRDLPGNPFGVEVRRFGSAVAVKIRSPQLRGKQRVANFAAADLPLLDELLNWYRQDALKCAIAVRYGEANRDLFTKFVAAGLISSGSGSVLVKLDDDLAPPTPANLIIRESLPDEREDYLDLFARCFEHRGEGRPAYRPIQWAEDGPAVSRRFIAEWDGQPVGMAAMPMIGRLASCATAGTLPEFRGRGVQTALIRHRLAEAKAAGVLVIFGGSGMGSAPYRNFERTGFRIVPLGMSWGMT